MENQFLKKNHKPQKIDQILGKRDPILLCDKENMAFEPLNTDENLAPNHQLNQKKRKTRQNITYSVL
jgi:hypothetical protein